MARTTISLPDALVERLDRVRERINVSRVCAAALERELDMLEARPGPADPEIEAVIQRFRAAADRWLERGYADGRQWALKVATRPELRAVAQPGPMHAALSRALGEDHHGAWPPSFDHRAALERWLAQDAAVAGAGPAAGGEGGEGGAGGEGGEAPTPRRRGRGEYDQLAYAEGWRKAATEIWQAVEPAFR
ncbi:MAG TPA: hypothetical protein VHS99_23880 [Chloroflexota bacterium]|nr:hypothetical protein [Chloroflexota bacterium]